MSDFDAEIPLGIMIGGSCLKALEPLEVIPCKDDGPYAYRTRLGWCSVGPPIPKKGAEDSFSYHKIKLSQFVTKVPSKDVVTGEMSNHHFSESANIKESSISHILAEMYDLEFNEINGDLEGPSHEDDRFNKFMQDKVEMGDGHYQIPYPFKGCRNAKQ